MNWFVSEFQKNTEVLVGFDAESEECGIVKYRAVMRGFISYDNLLQTWLTYQCHTNGHARVLGFYSDSKTARQVLLGAIEKEDR